MEGVGLPRRDDVAEGVEGRVAVEAGRDEFEAAGDAVEVRLDGAEVGAHRLRERHGGRLDTDALVPPEAKALLRRGWAAYLASDLYRT